MNAAPADPVPELALTFQGTPVSGGHVRARACVLPAVGDMRIDGGVILVTASLRANAVTLEGVSGVVVERGGTLSSGATLAREYRVPMVVLEGATTLLRTGDLVTLDGVTGAVVIERTAR